MRIYAVYIMASERYGTLYIGVTNDLIRRVYEHKEDLLEGFTKKHNVKNLVYFEVTDSIEGAILREKQLKTWQREWKIKLIQKDNLEWLCLYHTLYGSQPPLG